MSPGGPMAVAAWAELAAERETAGGGEPELAAAWDGGWWRGCQQRTAHAGRIGGRCRPTWVVVHTTDMAPATWFPLLTRLQRDRGKGNGAHFWVGRDQVQGVVQTAPVDRNAGHAGGATHGWFVGPDGKRYHPNEYSIGIEVHLAGAVILREGQWYAIDRSKDVDGDGRRDVMPTGAPIPAADVELDPRRPGRGWHKPSAYQTEQLAALLAAIGECPLRAPAPTPWSVRPNGAAQSWAPRAVIGGVPVVGHVTLDPADKLDPHPPLSRWLQAVSRAG
jgi:hypothetical protein